MKEKDILEDLLSSFQNEDIQNLDSLGFNLEDIIRENSQPADKTKSTGTSNQNITFNPNLNTTNSSNSKESSKYYSLTIRRYLQLR